MTITIDHICETDKQEWLPLWDDNNQGMGKEEVTNSTWARLNDESFPVFGLSARDTEGTLVGFLHYVLHPTTGSINPVCYMQDVYVSPNHRKKGIAKQLVVALAQIGQEKEWARIYWLAASNNGAAQALYKNIGAKLDFSFHILPLQ
jgi:ribosomal protein S18 acetylase RimI-like enzyme